MPPTIQTNLNAERDKRPQRPGERRSELVCRVKYCNTLPDIPFDPKFITYPFDSTRFIQYNPTSLERNYKYEVLTEHDLGVTIDLINKDTYSGEPGAQLDPADEKLLEEDVLTPQDSKRSRHHARSVSWLRRTEYISTEQTRFQPQTMDKVEAKVGYSIKKNFKDETLYMDRDSQIKAIEKTFEDSKKTIEKHYSKPNVVPVEVLPVYPDFKIWKYPCAQVIFDSDPAPTGRSVPAQIEEMSQAMIRGVMDESGEQFVAYFLPTEETLEKRRLDFSRGMDYEDDEEYEYKMAREYNWNVKSKASKGYEENYFLVMRQDGIYYNELETRVRLSKRRQKAGQQPNNTRLVVKHRPLSGPEHRMQRYREKQLEPPGEEDEEEDEEEEAPQASKSKDDEASQKDGDEDGEGDGDAERDGEEDGEGEGDRDDEDENKSDAEEGSEKGSGDENEVGDKSEEEGSGKEKSDSEGGGSVSDDQGQDGEEAGDGEEGEGEAEAGEEGEGEGGGEGEGDGDGEGEGEGEGDEEGDASGGEGSGSDGSRSSSPASRRSKSGSRSPASGSGDNRSSESGSESSSGSGSDSDNEKD